MAAESTKKTKAKTVGIDCPKCGCHIHLVITPTERRASPKLRKKIDRARVRGR